MKQKKADFLLQARIRTLRAQIVRAYDQTDEDTLRRVSREMDRLQCELWKRQAPRSDSRAS